MTGWDSASGVINCTVTRRRAPNGTCLRGGPVALVSLALMAWMMRCTDMPRYMGVLGMAAGVNIMLSTTDACPVPLASMRRVVLGVGRDAMGTVVVTGGWVAVVKVLVAIVLVVFCCWDDAAVMVTWGGEGGVIPSTDMMVMVVQMMIVVQRQWYVHLLPRRNPQEDEKKRKEAEKHTPPPPHKTYRDTGCCIAHHLIILLQCYHHSRQPPTRPGHIKPPTPTTTTPTRKSCHTHHQLQQRLLCNLVLTPFFATSCEGEQYKGLVFKYCWCCGVRGARYVGRASTHT